MAVLRTPNEALCVEMKHFVWTNEALCVGWMPAQSVKAWGFMNQ
tara:strand:- start:2777 stop:2908 length:132 start_codon:yes stop_codon:yes gene_type:complete